MYFVKVVNSSYLCNIISRQGGVWRRPESSMSSNKVYTIFFKLFSVNELPGIQASADNLNASFGEKVVLRCRFNSSSPRTKLVDEIWFKGDKLTDSPCKEVLSVTIDKPSDGGLHRCVLKTLLGGTKQYNITRDFFITGL